jgi:hypothetical protein
MKILDEGAGWNFVLSARKDDGLMGYYEYLDFRNMTDEELSKLPPKEFGRVLDANRIQAKDDIAFRQRLRDVVYARLCLAAEAEADDPANTTT